MSSLSSLLSWIVGQFMSSPLLASVLGTALALALATATSVALYKMLQSACERISAGPLFLTSASTIAIVYAILLGYLSLTGRTFEEGVIEWVTGLTGESLEGIGTYRNALLLALFYVVLQVVYLLLIVLLAWLLGFFSRDRDRGGVARQVEEELGSRYVERLFKLCGYYRADAPEKRFAEYGKELARAMRWAVWLSLPAAVTGAIPVALWVVGAIVADGFRRNLTAPPETPVEEERAEEQADITPPAVPDPNQLVHALRVDPRGPQLALVASGTLPGRPEHTAATTRVQQESELCKDILRALEIDGFFVHQEAAAEAILSGKDVLMETPPLSGRRTLCDVLAMRAVLLEGGTVLCLSPDAAESARRAEAFRGLAQRSNWRWAIYHHDLAAAGREGLDLKLRQPQIVFATPAELHGDMAPLYSDWDFFLRNLALIVAVDLDRYAGACGSNLAYVMRRLGRVCGHVGAEPRVLATVAPYGPDVQGFAERLMARPLQVIGPESNSRGAATQYAVLGESRPGAALHPAVSSRGVAIACGYRGEIWGYDAVLSSFEQQQQVNKVLLAFNRAVISTQDETDLRFDDATAIVARMSSATAAMLPFFTCHAGRAALGVASMSAQEVGQRGVERDAPTLPFSGFERPDDEEPAVELEADEQDEPEEAEAQSDEAESDEGAAQAAAAAAAMGLQADMAVSIWLPDGDSFARLLARHPNWVHPAGLHPMMKLGASLVATADNATIARRHLLCAVREVALRKSEATADYPASAVAELVERSGHDERLFEQSRLRLAPDGQVESIVELGLEGEIDDSGSTLVASDETAQLVNRAGGEVVLETDRCRIATVAYPGRVLVRSGRRYRVLLPEEQSRTAEGVLWAEPERRRIHTARVRTLAVEVEGRGHELRLGGGVAVHFHHPNVLLQETIHGVRHAHEARGSADTILYDEPIEARYETRAAALHLPPASAGALEALELLVRVTLPAFVRHTEDDLDVGCTHGDAPSLLVVDRHPGSVGFARAVSSTVLRHALYWAKQIVDRCGQSEACQRDDGCPMCIDGAHRLTPDGGSAPSRRAVVELLEKLLGTEAD